MGESLKSHNYFEPQSLWLTLRKFLDRSNSDAQDFLPSICESHVQVLARAMISVEKDQSALVVTEPTPCLHRFHQ